MFRLLLSIDNQWYEIGQALQVPDNVLDALKLNPDHNLFKLSEVIKCWLTTQPSPITWETVIVAIENPIVNFKMKADMIYRCLRGKIIRVLFSY